MQFFQIRATDHGNPPKHAERSVHLNVISDGLDSKGVDLKSLKITSNLDGSPLHVAASDPIGHRVGILEAAFENGGDGRRIWFYLLGKLF